VSGAPAPADVTRPTSTHTPTCGVNWRTRRPEASPCPHTSHADHKYGAIDINFLVKKRLATNKGTCACHSDKKAPLDNIAQHGVKTSWFETVTQSHLSVQDGDVAAVQVVAVEAVLGVGGVSGVVELAEERTAT